MIPPLSAVACVGVVAAPASLFLLLVMSLILNRKLEEEAIQRLVISSILTGVASTILVIVIMLTTGQSRLDIVLGHWLIIPDQHFHLSLEFIFDRLSVPMLALTYTLCGVVSAFANSYLHRDSGYRRFFTLFSVFMLGMVASSVAGTVETLFAGWELVGLSSAFLVAYFHERRAPVENGLRIWSVYRISDAAFLAAAVTLHHVVGEGSFDALIGSASWPEGEAPVTPAQATLIGMLLLIAAAGKSALIPFSGWLPRAMEGPTPSSAIFYGALSVHLGAFLLLRAAPILDHSPWVCATAMVLGIATAIHGSMASRVQTDIKSTLAYASLTQVGIIVAEIGFGLRFIPIIHIVGHATVRTLQLLRAPTLLHDYQLLENAVGGPLGDRPGLARRLIGDRLTHRLYWLSLQRGHWDQLLDLTIVGPARRLFRRLDRWERRWLILLSGEKETRRSVPGSTEVMDDLL